MHRPVAKGHVKHGRVRAAEPENDVETLIGGSLDRHIEGRKIHILVKANVIGLIVIGRLAGFVARVLARLFRQANRSCCGRPIILRNSHWSVIYYDAVEYCFKFVRRPRFKPDRIMPIEAACCPIECSPSFLKSERFAETIDGS